MIEEKRKYPCVFIDETGTGKDEPFFGVGFLKITNPYLLSSALLKPHTKAKSLLASERKKLQKQILADDRHISPSELNIMMSSTKHNEFHFTDLHLQNLVHYNLLLEAIKPHDFHFCALMVNKKDPDFNPEIYKNPWDFYLSLMKILCEKNIYHNETASIIVDYMTKPKISNKHLDEELFSLGKKVANVQAVDSVGVSLVQLCDLFLGAVAFENKKKAGFVNYSNNTIARNDFVAKLCEIIGFNSPDDFLENKTIDNNGKHFSVWHLNLKK